MKEKAAIFCGGPMDTYDVFDCGKRDEFLVICADSGLKHTKKMGIVPDAVIGDFDSYDISEEEYKNCIVYPPEKDKTDSNICLDYAIEKGCREVYLFGGFGGRIDHEYSTFTLLLYGLKRGVRVYLVNGQNEVWLADKPFSLTPNHKKYVSFFPYGGNVEGFTVKGLKYSAENITLDCGMAQASSNEFTGSNKAEVSFNKGYVLVMRCKDKGQG